MRIPLLLILVLLLLACSDAAERHRQSECQRFCGPAVTAFVTRTTFTYHCTCADGRSISGYFQ